jgi:hypothetical protein
MNITTIHRLLTKQEMRIAEYKTNHILHLLLSLIGGLWIPFWILITISNANERMKARKEITRLEMALGLAEVE